MPVRWQARELAERLTEMTNILGLETKLTTPRFEETRDWYRDLLGLSLLEQWDEPGDKGCILGFAESGNQAFLEIYAGEQSSDFTGLSLQVRIENVDRFPIPADDRFNHRGPEDRPWGSRYLFFTDPNGVSVVLFSGSSH